MLKNGVVLAYSMPSKHNLTTPCFLFTITKVGARVGARGVKMGEHEVPLNPNTRLVWSSPSYFQTLIPGAILRSTSPRTSAI